LLDIDGMRFQTSLDMFIISFSLSLSFFSMVVGKLEKLEKTMADVISLMQTP
jgi:hypothetical protein